MNLATFNAINGLKASVDPRLVVSVVERTLDEGGPKTIIGSCSSSFSGPHFVEVVETHDVVMDLLRAAEVKNVVDNANSQATGSPG